MLSATASDVPPAPVWNEKPSLRRRDRFNHLGRVVGDQQARASRVTLVRGGDDLLRIPQRVDLHDEVDVALRDTHGRGRVGDQVVVTATTLLRSTRASVYAYPRLPHADGPLTR